MTPPPFLDYRLSEDSSHWHRHLKSFDWLLHYDRANLGGDLMAGLVVAIMLVPQGMAYALLAGLPPEAGLYASIVPLLIYGLLGSSRVLSVAPVAMLSLIATAAIHQLEPATTADYINLMLILALLVGVIQLIMGLLRVGFLVNFLSYPVLSGFTSAAAVLIFFSQLKHLLGIEIPRTEYFYEIFPHLNQQIKHINTPTLLITSPSLGILFYFKTLANAHLARLGFNQAQRATLSKMGPLVVVLLSTVVVGLFSLNKTANIAIVGDVPAGLPPISLPDFALDDWHELIPTALTIAVIGYVQGISMAKSLASKKRQKVAPNRELVAIGLANIGTSLSGGFPVAGGFARSVVNYTAGANTGLASMITATLIFITVLFLTPLFYFLPTAVLAAIIVVAVASLLDMQTLRHTWGYNRPDAFSLIITFGAVLAFGLDVGIGVGVLSSIGLYLWRTSRPHFAIVGQIGDTEEYRNVLRHQVTTHPNILSLRIDESLYFPNAQYLEDVVLIAIADNPAIEHFVLVCNAVNYIDASALVVLQKLQIDLKTNQVSFNMAEVKGPVMDRLETVGFVANLGAEHFFISTHIAMETLRVKSDEESV